MRFVLLSVVFVLSMPGLARAADYVPGDFINMGFDVPESSGRILLRNLLDLANADENLIPPDSKLEDDLVGQVDAHLLRLSERILREPMDGVVEHTATLILVDFYQVAGSKALAQGATREQFRALVVRSIRPAKLNCDRYLNIHREAKSSRFGNH